MPTRFRDGCSEGFDKSTRCGACVKTLDEGALLWFQQLEEGVFRFDSCREATSYFWFGISNHCCAMFMEAHVEHVQLVLHVRRTWIVAERPTVRFGHCDSLSCRCTSILFGPSIFARLQQRIALRSRQVCSTQWTVFCSGSWTGSHSSSNIVLTRQCSLNADRNGPAARSN